MLVWNRLIENNFVLVLIGHSPFILNGNTRIILHSELLFGGDTSERWRIEQLFLREAYRWRVAVSLKKYRLYIDRGIVEHELSREVVESW